MKTDKIKSLGTSTVRVNQVHSGPSEGRVSADKPRYYEEMPPEPQFKRGPEWVHKMDATLIAPYAIPVAFGRRPHPRETADINAATGSVVDLGETPFLLTAAHVMQAGLARLQESRSAPML